MSDTTRPHPRVDETAVSGRRIPLSVGSLLLPEKPRKVVPLVIHFHGEPWLAEWSVRQRSKNAAVIALHLGGGSGVYTDSMKAPGRFRAFIAEAKAAAKVEFRPIYITSFSAGYGAIREILKDPANLPLVDGVLLMDSLHSGYESGTTPGPVEAEPMAPFLGFARAAMANKKVLVITHSEVYPGTFASTTETADFLIAQLKLRRTALLDEGPNGMQQLSRVRAGHFELEGFAGNSAPDHVDHFQSMSEWLRKFKLN